MIKVMEPTDIVRIESLDNALASLQTHSLLTGPGVLHFADQLPDSIVTAEAEHQMPQAAAMLPSARGLIVKGQWADPDTLEPVYLRRSYAEESYRHAPS